MTKVEALELALKGKRVKHVTWPKDEYVYYDFRVGKFKEENGQTYDINDSYDVNSWEEHFEPVTKYYWNIKFNYDSRPTISCEMFENESKLFNEFNPDIIEWVEKIDKSAKTFRE